MPDPSPPAASAVETAEDFADMVAGMVTDGWRVADLIRSRDRAVRREALAPFAWAIAEAFRCEKDIEIRVGSLTTVVTAADVRRALATAPPPKASAPHWKHCR